MIWAEIGTGMAVLALVYTFLRNFKTDLKEQVKGITDQINKICARQDDLDARIFFLATGKTLREAILEEKMRRGEK